MMLTVITDDLVIDMEQVLYLSKDAHPYTLRFRGGEELELTLAEWQAVIAKLTEAERTVGHALVPEYPGGSDPFETPITGGCDPFETPITDSASVTDTCCDNEDEIDPDEYLHAIEACGVPVERKVKPDESEWIAAKDCKLGVFYENELNEKLFCVEESSATRLPRFVCVAGLKKGFLTSYPDSHKLQLTNAQWW